MPQIDLFQRKHVIGIFRGFQAGGLEFHADLALPYRNDFQNLPMHGQFLLVQLETPDEAVLGRIASFSSEGKLSSEYGEEFNIRAMRDERTIPEDLREEYLKYRVNIRVLGVLRNNGNGKLTFVASHRRLPHVGSPVAFPSDEVLQEIVGHTSEGAEIGYFALGEYIYASGSKNFRTEDWMQIKSPKILVKFPVESLISRRSFIFARAGFGKSNLNKLLFSKLYAQTPMTTKRGGKLVPVGSIIFDPDGEYFWPDDKGRPGLCDVPELQNQLVVFTSREGPSKFYNSFVAGNIKLDIRRLKPADVIGIALSPERQDQQNVRKLKGLDQGSWSKLVDLINQHKNQTPLTELGTLLGLEPRQQEVEALAARGNMSSIVSMLHDQSSQLMDMLIDALSQGKLCIVDISQLRGSQALILSGLILRWIFDRNQQEFTKQDPKTIPTIAVIEEAQSVLNNQASASEPYISWVKEGRKYDLGSLLITQQPGSIPVDILSQGDNWFIFHLLSATDLTNVRRANAHFSDDILSVLLNEPIPGQGVYWSSVGGKPYPVSVRISSFEHIYKPLDPNYNRSEIQIFAQELKKKFKRALEKQVKQTLQLAEGTSRYNTLQTEPLFEESHELIGENGNGNESPDALTVYKQQAIEALRDNPEFMQKIQTTRVPWGVIMGMLEKALPDVIELRERDQIAYNLVPEAMESILGPRNEAWHTFSAPTSRSPEKNIVWVKKGKQE